MLELFILNTIKIGSLYALVAMAFRLMFNVSPFFNISLGTVAIVASYTMFFFVDNLGWSLYLAIPLSLTVGAALSYAFERLVYQPLRKNGSSSMILLVVSLGLYMIFEALIDIIFGPKYRTLTDVMNIKMVELAGNSITITQIITISLSLVVLAFLSWFLKKTFMGKQIRAIKNNPDLAIIYGMKTNTIICYVSILTGLILGAVGIITIYETGVDPNMGFNLIFKGIIAALIGGISIWGVFLGGLFLAFSENLGVWVFASEWRDAVAFTIFIIFLSVKPWIGAMLSKRKKS